MIYERRVQTITWLKEKKGENNRVCTDDLDGLTINMIVYDMGGQCDPYKPFNTK